MDPAGDPERRLQELQGALARYTDVFDFAPVGYAILAPDGTILEISHAGARMLGMPRRSLVQRKFELSLAARDRAAFLVMLDRVLDDEMKACCDVVLVGDGPRMVLGLTATRLPREEPTVLLAYTDVTDERDRETRLAETEAALRDAERRKDDFLSALSHELRNPLGPIRNSLFLLAQTTPPGGKARDQLEVIDRQVGQMTRLVDDLLDVTRIARGKVQVRRERLELGHLVSHTVDDHRASFEANGVRLERHVRPGIWVDADPTRLVQVVSNLLSNALKFTPRGERVTVTLGHEDGRCVLHVRDTGGGIDPATLPHLFEPFSQGPQPSDRSHGGLGLGLATVKGLVVLHGGSVSIASEGPGRGTEVTVALPTVAPPKSWTNSMISLPKEGPRRVLVIDDNVDGANTLSEALTLLGHDARAAYTGNEGIELAHTFHPDVLICDIGLPDIDGYAVARAFRADEELRSCFLVALSGYAQAQDVERMNEAGFDRNLAKPASIQRFAELLAQVPAQL